MTSARVTAEVLADHLEDARKIATFRAILEVIHHSDRPLNAEEISRLASPDIDESSCEKLLLMLEDAGALQDEGVRMRVIDQICSAAEVIAAAPEEPENDLVANIPPDESSVDRTDFESLVLGLREVVDDVDQNLYLMSPYLSSGALEAIQGRLRRKVEEGARIHLITRFLTDDGADDYNRRFVEKLYDEEAIRANTRLYEYQEGEGNAGATFHAKLVLADGTSAYLGTANLTYRGLAHNLEVGLIFRDRTVEKLRRLILSVLDSEFTHPVEVDGASFVRT